MLAIPADRASIAVNLAHESGGDHPPSYTCDRLVFKGPHELGKPRWLRLAVVIEEGHDIAFCTGETANNGCDVPVPIYLKPVNRKWSIIRSDFRYSSRLAILTSSHN
jgi:hypothetical protein